MSVIQQLHDLKIGGGVAWPKGGGILIYLGCPLVRDSSVSHAIVGSFVEAEDWMRQQAVQHYHVMIANQYRRRAPYLIDRLLAGGIPGSAFWIDGTFAATIASERSEGLSN
jgi:hypothetical protein